MKNRHEHEEKLFEEIPNGVEGFVEQAIQEGKEKLKSLTHSAEEKLMEEITSLKNKLNLTEEGMKDLKKKSDAVIQEHPYSIAMGAFFLGILSASFYKTGLKKTV